MADTKAADILAAVRETGEPIRVTLRGGLQMEFRRPTGADEYLTIGTRAKKFAAAVRRAAHPSYAQYSGLSEEVITAAYWIHALGTAPEWAQQEALELAATCGPAVLLVYSRIMTACAEAVVADEVEALDTLGEDFEPTPSGETT